MLGALLLLPSGVALRAGAAGGEQQRAEEAEFDAGAENVKAGGAR